MKRLIGTALFLAATFLPAVASLAQEHNTQANIPFNFSVGEASAPAGTYRLSTDPGSPLVVKVQCRDKKVQVLTLGRPADSGRNDESVLVFHRYGGQYFLSDIRSSSADMNIHFPTSKAEKRARTQTEEAGLFPSDPVMVTLY